MKTKGLKDKRLKWVDWDSFGNSVRLSVWYSVMDSVYDSALFSVRCSVADSVGRFVANSIEENVFTKLQTLNENKT